MKPGDLLLHCYFERDGDQWLAFCLDFTLVAQAGTLPEAADKLRHQMVEYVRDATVGEDHQHAAYLLRRRAPLGYWLKFYWVMLRQVIHHNGSKRRLAEREAMPLVPAAC